MRSLVEEIFALPGVAGACVVDRRGGQLCAKGHEKLPAGLLDTLALHTARLFQMGNMSGFDISTAQFFFDSYGVLAQPLSSGGLFLALCIPHADCARIAETVAKLAAIALPVEIDLPDEISADSLQTAEPEASSVHLQAMLGRIEEALTGAVGPVAGMVMQDYIDRWRQSGPAVPARLVELTSMLVDEIGEPEAAQDFVAKIEQII